MTEETQQQSIGLRLRETRRQKDLTPEAVAEQLNLNVRSIEALETDDFGSISPPMFTRGYLRAYAKLLGIDSDELIEEYNKLAPPDPELSSAYQPMVETKSSHPIVRWATLAIVLVTGTLLVFWWYGPRYQGTEEAFLSPESTESDSTTVVAEVQQTSQPTAETETGLDVEPTSMIVAVNSISESAQSAEVVEAAVNTSTENILNPAQVVDTEENVVDNDSGSQVANPTFVASSNIRVTENESEVINSNSPVPEQQSASTIEALTGIGSAMAVPSPSLVEVDVDAAQPDVNVENVETVTNEQSSITVALADTVQEQDGADQIAGGDVMEIQTTSESWVEVIDANGARLMYGMLGDGRSRTIRGVTPFQVFLGNTPGISMIMNGGAVDQPQYNAITNTSRFSVNADGSMQR